MPPKKQPKSQKKVPTILENSSSDSEDEYLSANTANTAKIDPSDFIYCLKAALLDQGVANQLQACLSPLIGELKQEVDELKCALQTKDSQIMKLQEEIDDLKQDSKSHTLRFDGLEEESGQKIVEETVCDFVTQTLRIPLNTWEIETCFRIGKKVNNTDNPRRIVVQLLNLGKVKKILGAKKELRKNRTKPIYINQDLIPKRAELFKTAREYVKTDQLYRTWIFNGQVYIKKKADQDGIIVKSMSSLNMLASGN